MPDTTRDSSSSTPPAASGGKRAASEPPGSAAPEGGDGGSRNGERGGGNGDRNGERPAATPDEQIGRQGPLSLLDGASSPHLTLSPELDEQRRVASDRGRNLETRLEAYQDILDSEVGDTTLARARNLEREVNLRQIYLKFEGSNPTGTQKDRIAFAQCSDAVRRSYDAITVATCGNYGVAIALAAWIAGLRCVIYIPESYSSGRVKEMVEYGAEIVRVPGHYEHAVDVSREQAAALELYDANPGGANTPLQIRNYGEIANEIYDELRDAPLACAVPVSNGTTLAGIFRGFQSLDRRGKTSRIPRMVAGSSFRKNPIVQAFMKNSQRCEDLDPASIRETAVNEPLINWRSIDGNEALLAIRSSGGWADDASDRQMLACARMLREREGLHVLPASTAGLVALLERHKKEPLPGDRYVVILTGRRA
jgi:threonine synthase